MCAPRNVLKEENVRTLFFDQRFGQEYRLDSIQKIFPSVDDESQVNWIVSKEYRHLKQFINVSGEDSLRGKFPFWSLYVDHQMRITVQALSDSYFNMEKFSSI